MVSGPRSKVSALVTGDQVLSGDWGTQVLSLVLPGGGSTPVVSWLGEGVRST